MTILQSHTLFDLVADKKGSDFWSHAEKDNLLDIAQMEYFAQLIGNYKQHQPGRPVPNIAVGQNSRLSEELNPFKSKISFHADQYDPTTMPYGVEDGVLVLPSDYEHMSAIFSVVAHPTAGTLERPVDDIDDEEWAWRSSSWLIPPSQLNAMYRWNGTAANGNLQLEFRPKDISGHLIYYRRPAKPNYVFTINTTTRVEAHDAGASTDLEWGEVAAFNILVRALELAGVPQADDRLKQAMMQNKMESE
jgi:hypothetical protein